jgi:hypothetical protein
MLLLPLKIRVIKKKLGTRDKKKSRRNFKKARTCLIQVQKHQGKKFIEILKIKILKKIIKCQSPRNSNQKISSKRKISKLKFYDKIKFSIKF